jgi:hypothetical protein
MFFLLLFAKRRATLLSFDECKLQSLVCQPLLSHEGMDLPVELFIMNVIPGGYFILIYMNCLRTQSKQEL